MRTSKNVKLTRLVNGGILAVLMSMAGTQYASAQDTASPEIKPTMQNRQLDVPEKVFEVYLELIKKTAETGVCNSKNNTEILSKNGITREQMKNAGTAYAFYLMARKNQQAELFGYTGISSKTKALLDKYGLEIEKFSKKLQKTKARKGCRNK